MAFCHKTKQKENCAAFKPATPKLSLQFHYVESSSYSLVTVLLETYTTQAPKSRRRVVCVGSLCLLPIQTDKSWETASFFLKIQPVVKKGKTSSSPAYSWPASSCWKACALLPKGQETQWLHEHCLFFKAYCFWLLNTNLLFLHSSVNISRTGTGRFSLFPLTP